VVSSSRVLVIPGWSVKEKGIFFNYECVPIFKYYVEWRGQTMVKRDAKHSKKGQSPAFQIRITPELKAQFEAAAKAEGVSLGNWFKNLGRKELMRLGVINTDSNES